MDKTGWVAALPIAKTLRAGRVQFTDAERQEGAHVEFVLQHTRGVSIGCKMSVQAKGRETEVME